MGDADDFFDATLKKKKKKKKIIASLDDDDVAAPVPAGEAAGDDAAPAPAAAAAPEVDEVASLLSDTLDLGKKKKKKKKVFDPDLAVEEDAPAADAADAPAAKDPLADDLDLGSLGDDLALPTKKKKKKKKDGARPTAAVEPGAEEDAGDKPAWADSDRDYEYEELLQRVFDIMRQKNPEMMTNAKKTFVMKPPQVMKVGSKKTAFSNFNDICKLLHRSPDHFLGFILAELGTSGSVDGSQSLVLKGRFTQRNIETVLKGYIREYVTCKLCKSPNTILSKDNRLFFLQCETCGSKRSVASIKTGYQAQIGRRSAMRAKAST